MIKGCPVALPSDSSFAPGSTTAPSNPPKVPGEAYPWEHVVDSTFFSAPVFDYTLWDQLAPYRLLVFDTKDGKIVSGSSVSDVELYPLGNMSFAFKPLTTAWIYNLPITPQQLTISDQYAINTTATLKGIVEEHSGIRFKNIAIQGTFGVWAQRPNLNKSPAASGPVASALQSIFGGTIASAQNVATQFTSVINTAFPSATSGKPATVRPGDPGDNDRGKATGYMAALGLQTFLEQYAEAKKDPKHANWRLVFDIPKQAQSFVVSPVDFKWMQNVSKPMEVNFSLQLKAWRRIDLTYSFIDQGSNVTKLTPGILQKILNTISAARNTAAAASSLIGAVRSDVDNVLSIISQTGLLIKDLAGVALSIADLPGQLASDAKSTISGFLSTFNKNNLTGDASSDSKTLKALSNIQTSSSNREGISLSAVSGGQLGPSAAAAASIDPANNVFANPHQYAMLLDQVPVNSLTLNTAQQAVLDNAIDAARALTVNDLKDYRATVLSLCTQLTNSFGAGDAFYSKVYGTNTPSRRIDAMTLDEFDIVQSFYDLLDAYDVLTATMTLDESKTPSNMAYVQSLANASGIEFSSDSAKILVPVPFGLTVEGIALRYLGDAQRWLEIVTLNNLREPYIDEDGFQYALLSNGNGRQVTVASNTNLYIGQKVLICSSAQGQSARTILGITTLSGSSYLITLDGLANLNSFRTTDSAYLQAYLPGTTNSQNNIFIPSTLPASPDDMISIPATVASTKLVGLSKVDLLLTDSGDVATNSYGDFRFSAGMTNLIQALKIKFGTATGSVYLHPTFGLGTRVGSSISDLQAKDLYNQINKLITADPRFSGLNGLQVNLSGSTLSISLAVGLPGVQGVFPLNFTLPTY